MSISLILNRSSDNTVDQNEFLFSVDGKIGLPYSSSRTAKYKANNKIIESVLNIGTHKKQALFLQCALSRHRFFK